MSLGKLNGVHPYVSDRVRRILAIADQYRAEYTVTSGERTAGQQQRLYFDHKTNTPPGCSQHQYGLAVDVKFTGKHEAWWQDYYRRAARHLGLVIVENDPVHVQAIPGSTFRQLAVAARVCHPQVSLESRTWRDCLLHASGHTKGHRHSCKLPCGGAYGIACT